MLHLIIKYVYYVLLINMITIILTLWFMIIVLVYFYIYIKSHNINLLIINLGKCYGNSPILIVYYYIIRIGKKRYKYVWVVLYLVYYQARKYDTSRCTIVVHSNIYMLLRLQRYYVCLSLWADSCYSTVSKTRSRYVCV